MDDGRKIQASPDHPDTAGKSLVSYQIGDSLDGSIVQNKKLIPFGGDKTWDILPAGPTGVYKANGVWLGSTLKSPGDALSDVNSQSCAEQAD